MGEAATYLTGRDADLERRRERAQRDRTRRQERAAKRSRAVVSDLRALDALLEGDGNRVMVEPKDGAARLAAASTTESALPSACAQAERPETRGSTFAERRQLAADQARDRATAAVAEEARQGGERRSAERELARRALRTLSLDARYAEARGQIEVAIAADDPTAVRAAARRALWSAAGDAALRAESDACCEGELSVCAALAVIEWLPISAIRVGRRAARTVAVPASGPDPASRSKAMVAQTVNGGAQEMEPQEPGAEAAFVVRLRDRCEPRLTGGYEGCEFELPVASRALAQALVGALLERDHTEQLAAGMYAKPLAGGTRTVVMEPRR